MTPFTKTAALTILATAGFMLANSARASVIWDGNASKGTSVFKQLNIEDGNGNATGNPSPSGSAITVVTDPTYGKVFKFDKATGDLRCEAHGAAGFNPAIGSTYYIGWRSKLSDLTDNFANFQWKAFGDGQTQNHPIMLSMEPGNLLRLSYYKPGDIQTTLWSQTITTNKWYTHVVMIKVSDSATAGKISYYFGTGIETLTNGSTIYTGRTFDGTSVDPKWGVYGAESAHQINYVGQLKIGTTYADVAP